MNFSKSAINHAPQKIFFCLFFLTQLFIAYIFINLGRDNEEYTRLFEVGDVSYLEPFWIFYSSAIDAFGVSSLVQPIYGLFIILVFSAFLFFGLAISDTTKWVPILLILATVFSYQISLVTGALRQGVSFFLFSSFLLCIKEKYLFAAVATHVSGIAYIVFSRYFLILTFIGLLGYLAFGANDFQFIDGALGRVSGYIEVDDKLNISSIFLFSTLKIVLIFLFVINRHHLKEKIKSSKLLYSIIFTPVLQILIYVFIQNPIITDRVNLLLDPFLLVATCIIATKVNAVNVIILLLIIIPKFISRIYFAFSW